MVKVQSVDLLVHSGLTSGLRVKVLVNNEVRYGSIDLRVLKDYIHPKYLKGLNKIDLGDVTKVNQPNGGGTFNVVNMSYDLTFCELVRDYLIQRVEKDSNRVGEGLKGSKRKINYNGVKALYDGINKFNVSYQQGMDIGVPIQYRRASITYLTESLYSNSLLYKVKDGYIDYVGYQLYLLVQSIGNLVTTKEVSTEKIRGLVEVELTAEMQNTLLRYAYYLNTVYLPRAKVSDDHIVDSEGLTKYAYVLNNVVMQLKTIDLIRHEMYYGKEKLALKPVLGVSRDIVLVEHMLNYLHNTLDNYLTKPKETDDKSGKSVNNKKVVEVLNVLQGVNTGSVYYNTQEEIVIVDTLEAYILDLKGKLALLKSGSTKTGVYLTGYKGYIKYICKGEVLEKEYMGILKELEE